MESILALVKGNDTSSKYLGSTKNLNATDQCTRLNALYRAAHKDNISILTEKIDQLAGKNSTQENYSKMKKV